MFGRGKLPPRSHGQQMRDELAESYGHLRMAASHVVGGAAEKLTPTYDRTRDLAVRGWSSTRGGVAPILRQMKDGAANARRTLKPESILKITTLKTKKKNRTRPALVGLLTAGAIAGAAGALITRRRRAAQQWDEYQPGHTGDGPITGTGTSATSGTTGPTGLGRAAKEKVATGVATAADRLSESAAKVSDRLHERAGDVGAEAAADRTTSAFSQFADEADEYGAKANASRNGRP